MTALASLHVGQAGDGTRERARASRRGSARRRCGPVLTWRVRPSDRTVQRGLRIATVGCSGVVGRLAIQAKGDCFADLQYRCTARPQARPAQVGEPVLRGLRRRVEARLAGGLVAGQGQERPDAQGSRLRRVPSPSLAGATGGEEGAETEEASMTPTSVDALPRGWSEPPATRSRSGSGRGKSFNDSAASLRNWRTTSYRSSLSVRQCVCVRPRAAAVKQLSLRHGFWCRAGKCRSRPF
jgi:hypothetical protein